VQERDCVASHGRVACKRARETTGPMTSSPLGSDLTDFRKVAIPATGGQLPLRRAGDWKRVSAWCLPTPIRAALVRGRRKRLYLRASRTTVETRRDKLA